MQNLDLSGKDIAGVLIQYPNTDGCIQDFSSFVAGAHKNGVSFINFYNLL